MARGQLPSAWNENLSLVERDRHGKIIRRRFYGPDGGAIKNIDYEAHHGAPSPHAHDWDWTKVSPRQPSRALNPDE